MILIKTYRKVKKFQNFDNQSKKLRNFGIFGLFTEISEIQSKVSPHPSLKEKVFFSTLQLIMKD